MNHPHPITLSVGAAVAVWLSLTPNSGHAQGLPSSQPKIITIIQETVKPGMAAKHAKHEAGWPAAFEKAKSPNYYVAMTSLTGPPRALYVVPYESYAAIGASLKREDDDRALSDRLAELSSADAEYISDIRILQGMARPDLSLGAFPDIGRARFFEITVFQVRPGHSKLFEQAAKAYGAARTRVDAKLGYRVYEVTAGMPAPAFVVIASVEDYAGFDRMGAVATATMEKASAEEMAVLEKFSRESLLSTEVNHYRVDPMQSYVPRETRAQDPSFWKKK